MSPLTRQRQTSNFEIRQVSKRKKGMDHTKRMHVKNYETIFDSFYPCLDGILWPIGNLVAFKFYAKCERADAK